jgi:predicted enzyme related to lactoylglutathione lyase
MAMILLFFVAKTQTISGDTAKDPLIWFEIPVPDFERTRKFYSKIYDYEMPSMQMDADQLGYFQVQPKHVGGAIHYSVGLKPSKSGSLTYLNGGEDLNVVCGRAEQAGGKVLQGKAQTAPEHGYFALFPDTEGNRVALHSMPIKKGAMCAPFLLT